MNHLAGGRFRRTIICIFIIFHFASIILWLIPAPSAAYLTTVTSANPSASNDAAASPLVRNSKVKQILEFASQLKGFLKKTALGKVMTAYTRLSASIQNWYLVAPNPPMSVIEVVVKTSAPADYQGAPITGDCIGSALPEYFAPTARLDLNMRNYGFLKRLGSRQYRNYLKNFAEYLERSCASKTNNDKIRIRILAVNHQIIKPFSGTDAEPFPPQTELIYETKD